MSSDKKSMLVPFLIIAGMFFVFGFVTWINGALIPFMKTMCELSDAESFLVVSASYISFVVMAIPASMLLKVTGYRRGMSLGLILMGVGAVIFIPAASIRAYWLFLVGIFVQGAGMTILQTASNPYITILGPIESAAKRISIMGICNKFAGALGSIIFGYLLLSGIKDINEKLDGLAGAAKADVLNEMADSVVGPYIVMAIALGVLGVFVNFAPLPDLNMGEDEDDSETSGEEATTKKTSILQFPHLLLGVLALFMYVGVEVAAGDTIIAYGIAKGLDGASKFTSFTLGFMVLTYLLGALLIPRVISQKTALSISAVLGVIFTFFIVFTDGYTSVLFVAALGIANALVWPAIWPLAINGLGKFTKTGAALLIMAIAGGAVISPLYGVLVGSQKTGGINEKYDNYVGAVNKAQSTLGNISLHNANKIKANIDTTLMFAGKDDFEVDKTTKFLARSITEVNKGFDSLVNGTALKDTLKSFMLLIKQDETLKASLGQTFIYTFSGETDVVGEFNNWRSAYFGIFSNPDKDSTVYRIDEHLKKGQDLKAKLKDNPAAATAFEAILAEIETKKANVNLSDETQATIAKASKEFDEATVIVKESTYKASTSGYWVLLPCYLIILFYAVKGHKIGLPKN